MEKKLFSPMEIDAIGEMMNISLGSSATAVSNMLDHRVDITTPQVTVVDVANFSIGNLEPAMGVEIKYVEGLEGSNIMLLRRSDIKVIVDILMGAETPDEEFELNELTVSAVCEVMNQMMGAASTALSDFLGFPVNISTPTPFELENLDEFKEAHLPQGADTVVVVRFSLKIENTLESEFMNVMSVSLAKELLQALGLGDEDGEENSDAVSAPSSSSKTEDAGSRQLSQAEIEKLLAANAGGAQQSEAPEINQPQTDSSRQLSQEEIERLMAANRNGEQPSTGLESSKQTEAGGSRQLSQEEIEKLMTGGTAASPQQTSANIPTPQAAAPQLGYPFSPASEQGGFLPDAGRMGYPPPYYPPYPYPYPYPPQQPAQQPDPKVIAAKPVPMPEMDARESLGKEQAQNLDLIMEVPVQVTVEIGRTQRKVQDILEFNKGSLVVLDKLAGDQVDLFVNGKCIAKGDVVVIDDNFGVRITEIVQKYDEDKKSKK